jgi:hypothetical protein
MNVSSHVTVFDVCAFHSHSATDLALNLSHKPYPGNVRGALLRRWEKRATTAVVVQKYLFQVRCAICIFHFCKEVHSDRAV